MTGRKMQQGRDIRNSEIGASGSGSGALRCLRGCSSYSDWLQRKEKEKKTIKR